MLFHRGCAKSRRIRSQARGRRSLGDRVSYARDPARVTVGRRLLAGNSQAIAVVRVVAVDDDGQVHFAILPGPVNKNQHLLDHASA